MQKLDVYCGTKRFNEVFTKMSTFFIKKEKNYYSDCSSCLNMIDNLIVKPSRVSTGMNNYSKGRSIIEPNEVAYGILRELG